MVILERLEDARRSHAVDLATVVNHFAETCAVTEKFDTGCQAGIFFEVGAGLSVLECARLIGMEGALYDCKTGRRHLSPLQVGWNGGLIREVPDAFRSVCARVAALEAALAEKGGRQ